jgi:hypothetical protein
MLVPWGKDRTKLGSRMRSVSGKTGAVAPTAAGGQRLYARHASSNPGGIVFVGVSLKNQDKRQKLS